MGAIGVAHSSSDKIDQFFATGDPDVFAPAPSANTGEDD